MKKRVELGWSSESYVIFIYQGDEGGDIEPNLDCTRTGRLRSYERRPLQAIGNIFNKIICFSQVLDMF